IPLDGKGQAVITENTAGSYSISATAKDAAGNVSTAVTATLTVSNFSGTPPTVSVTAPASAAVITCPTAVTGTVSDDHLGISYAVTVLPSDGTPAVHIGSGSTTTASS